MTTVDNGERLALTISGIFDGVCGVSRGTIAFVPNRTGRNPLQAAGAMLDGSPIRLSEVTRCPDGSFTARYQAIK